MAHANGGIQSAKKFEQPKSSGGMGPGANTVIVDPKMMASVTSTGSAAKSEMNYQAPATMQPPSTSYTHFYDPTNPAALQAMIN